MSVAFIKETENPIDWQELPDRPISPHANFVTPQGLAQMDEALHAFQAAYDAAHAADDKGAMAQAQRELRYWTARRSTAQVIEPDGEPGVVRFGATVTVEREDGRTQTFRIVGEDEADPAQGRISHASPLASVVMGKHPGDVAELNGEEVEVTAVG